MDVDDPRFHQFHELQELMAKYGPKPPDDDENPGFRHVLNGLKQHGPINYDNPTLDDYHYICSLIEVFQNDCLREICDDISSGKLDREFTHRICFSFKNRFQVFSEKVGIPSSQINDLINVWRPRFLKGFFEFSGEEKQILRDYDQNFFPRIWAIYHEEWDPVLEKESWQLIREKHQADLGGVETSEDQEKNAEPIKDPVNPPNKRDKAEWLAHAMLLVKDHPEWSNAKIAKTVGVSPSSISSRRCPEFHIAACLARTEKSNRPKGFEKIDPESGMREIEAFSNDPAQHDMD